MQDRNVCVLQTDGENTSLSGEAIRKATITQLSILKNTCFYDNILRLVKVSNKSRPMYISSQATKSFYF